VELNVPNGGGRADIVHCDAGQPAVNERGVVVAAGKQLVETTGAVLDLPLEQVCLSLAHEIGHALSLDHSSLCSASQLEIMYINGCSPNAQFSNETASCLSQDSVPRSCACSATQNSLQQLDSVLPVAGSSPSTTITSPAQGAQVARSQPFNVRATITTQGAVVTRAVLRWATVTRPDEELTSLGGNVWGKDNVSLDGVPDGEQRLRIIAYDSLDRKKKSKKRTFVVSSM